MVCFLCCGHAVGQAGQRARPASEASQAGQHRPARPANQVDTQTGQPVRPGQATFADGAAVLVMATLMQQLYRGIYRGYL